MIEMSSKTEHYVRAAKLDDVKAAFLTCLSKAPGNAASEGNKSCGQDSGGRKGSFSPYPYDVQKTNDHGALRFGVKTFQTALRSVGSLWPIYG